LVSRRFVTVRSPLVVLRHMSCTMTYKRENGEKKRRKEEFGTATTNPLDDSHRTRKSARVKRKVK